MKWSTYVSVYNLVPDYISALVTISIRFFILTLQRTTSKKLMKEELEGESVGGARRGDGRSVTQEERTEREEGCVEGILKRKIYYK